MTATNQALPSSEVLQLTGQAGDSVASGCSHQVADKIQRPTAMIPTRAEISGLDLAGQPDPIVPLEG